MPVESAETSGPNAHSSPGTEWWTPRLAGPIMAAAVLRIALLAAALARIGTSAILQIRHMQLSRTRTQPAAAWPFYRGRYAGPVARRGTRCFLAMTSLGGLPMAAAANVILSVFSVILVWRLGRTVFGDERIALGAAWIFAFEPVSVTYSCLPLVGDSVPCALSPQHGAASNVLARAPFAYACGGRAVACRGNLCTSHHLLPAGCTGSG